MTRQDFKSGDVVYFTWKDAMQRTVRWENRDQWKDGLKLPPLDLIHTCGFVVQVTDEALFIAPRLMNDCSCPGGVFGVPWVSIFNLRVIGNRTEWFADESTNNNAVTFNLNANKS